MRCPLNRKSIILYPNTMRPMNIPPVGRTSRVFSRTKIDLNEANPEINTRLNMTNPNISKITVFLDKTVGFTVKVKS
jgi:hypothetical protein